MTNNEKAVELIQQAMVLLWGDEMMASEGMLETPHRIVKHWKAVTKGLYEDPSEPLKKQFSCDHDEIVILKDIPFFSLCEHHLLPIIGTANVAYIPNGRVVGLSKIPRALDILAARPQLQERLTTELGGLVWSSLNPLGVAITVTATHTCMTTRGALKPGSTCTTSFMRGAFRENTVARTEFLELIK